MNIAPKRSELHERGHNHLERVVQPEGDCPGCDTQVWQPQHARLGPSRTQPPHDRPVVEKMCDEQYAPHPAYLNRVKCQHTCDKSDGHPSLNHHCRTCGTYWKQK